MLTLPPLTSRPNCTAHRIDFVEDAPDFSQMSEFLTSKFRERTFGLEWPQAPDGINQVPIVRVRHVTCSNWNTSKPDGDFSWSTEVRERHSPIEYADMEFGTPPEPPPGMAIFMFGRAPPWATPPRGNRIRAIRKDIRRLRELFDDEVGLGPQFLWEEDRYRCFTGMWNAGITYNAKKQILWLDDYKLELPQVKSPRPVANFDFDSFLSDQPSPFLPNSHENLMEWLEKERRKEEEDDEEEGDPWVLESLRCNGLYYW